MSSLPVALHVARALEPGLRRHLEGVLGWQVVDADLQALVRPVVALVDQPDQAVGPGVPVVQVVGPGLPAGEAAARAVALRPVAVVAWPDDRDELGRIVEVARQVATERGGEPEPTRTVVAGSSGGVGATTVTLALAGLCAWGGGPVLAVVRGDVPVPGVPRVDPGALRGPAAWTAAAQVPGLASLRVLDAGSASPSQGGVQAPVLVPEGVRVFVDAGTATGRADVLVVRRDRAGRDSVATSAAGAIVLVDDGVLPEGDLLEVAGGRTVVVLPWSARVARASLRRRVPTGLPGAWLAPLRLLLELEDQEPSTGATILPWRAASGP